MPRSKLKHYKIYLSRLELFAKAMDIEVLYVDSPQEGIWHPSVKRIKLKKDMPNTEMIATFLHELGHSMDDILSKNLKDEIALSEAYHGVYNDSSTKGQLEMVLVCERRAWATGKDIAKRLKIRLGKWYDDITQVSIKSYK